MKKLIVVAAAFMPLMAASPLEAQTNCLSSVTLRSVVGDKYLNFANGAELYGEPVAQSQLLVNFRNGFYIELWNSTPFGDWNENLGTEQDVGVGWTGPLSLCGLSGGFGETVLDIGVSYFDEPDLAKLGSDDIVKSYLQLSHDFTIGGHKFSALAHYRNYTAMPRSSFRGGSYLGVGMATTVPLVKVSITTSLSPVWDFGGFGADDGLMLQGGAELDWKLGKRITLILPQVMYYAPLTMDDRPLDAVVFGGFSIALW